MDYKNLKITTEQAEKIAFDLFGISGSASIFPGEVDFNFRIKVKNTSGNLLKISRPLENVNYLEYHQKLLLFLEKNESIKVAPKVIRDSHGNAVSEFTDDFGNIRKVRMLTWVPGRIWEEVNPQSIDLRHSLGKHSGALTNQLQGFDHPEAHRQFVWDVAQSLWTKEFIHLFNKREVAILSYFQEQFEKNLPCYNKLRKSVVHNDVNSHNIIVTKDELNPRVESIIDFGDAIFTQIINDVAIAGAYEMMNTNDPIDAFLPFLMGYHESFPLTEEELEVLYPAIAMRLAITVTKSAINKIKEPDNKYLLISEKPAWDLLYKWYEIDSEFAHYSFRETCGFSAHPNSEKFNNWVEKKENFKLNQLFPEIGRNHIYPLDLSVGSSWIGHLSEANDLDLFTFKISKLQQKHPNSIIAGGYSEARALYNTGAYEKSGNSGPESRTYHLGIDFWLPQETAVHALFDGEIITAVHDIGNKEYGGLIILKHIEEGIIFYSLYGHLSIQSIKNKKKGCRINKGALIGHIGNYPENGNWSPHLHFQLMLSLIGFKNDFPGVAYHKQLNLWKDICPDPNLLFNNKLLQSKGQPTNENLIAYRKNHLGKELSLQYKSPLRILCGSGVYLIDENGRNYLDTVNNVANVGHEHPRVVKSGQQQMGILNTNTRYLHPTITKLADQLLKTLPDSLNVIHFVNSGSEANELAIRMVKAATGQKDIIASELGYHGNSNMCIDISSYKFDGKGGQGAPEFTHIFPIPDAYQGKHKGKDVAKKYADEVQKQIVKVHKTDRKIAALIIEPIISCGGQIELPDGFLKMAYQKVRKAGGLCISDEVQTGCGRMGKTFWGFQLHDVIPDIVTIGKPLGNGHPVAAVACTQEVADKFANGMEYFNTFGGNPVSCAIASETLQVIHDEKLQENAAKTGQFLKNELIKLAKKYKIIGDVRGQGLFLGFELVDTNLCPLPEQTDYLINRMKDHGILMSSDGPNHNVIKIKPPLVFSKNNAKELLFYLKKVLAEDFMIQ